LSQLFVDAQGRRGRRVPVPSARPHGSPRPRHRHPTRRRSDADPAAVPRDEEWVGRSIHAPVSAAGLARPVDGRSELRGRPRPAAQGADRGSRPEVHRRRGRRDTARGSSRVSTPTMITVLGRRTRVRLEGDPDSPPVLLLHGSGRGLEDWAPQYPRLAGSHRVIALDLPGSGFSARAPEPTTLEVLARGVLETLDTLGERRPLHVIGNSLGGAVAMQLLVLDPARVASLVLVDSAGFGADIALALRLLAVPVLGELASRRTTRGGARMLERLIFADRTLATTARIEHALAIAGQPDTSTVVLETTRALATFRGVKPAWRAQ